MSGARSARFLAVALAAAFMGRAAWAGNKLRVRPPAGAATHAEPPTAADAGAPGPESFSARAPHHAVFGRTFAYTIEVTHPKGEVYALPDDLEMGAFALVDAKKRDVPRGDAVATVFVLKVRPWTVGKKKLPDLKLEVQSPSGESELTIPGPKVVVAGTLPVDGGAGGLLDIAPPVDVPVRTYRLLWALAAAVGLGGLGYALTKWLRRPKAAYVPPPVPLEPVEVRTRRALAALLAEDLAGQGRQRELYFRLSEVVRRYLGERFAFDAIDLTTVELLGALRTRSTPGLDLSAFARDCEAADLVKFAKLQPDANACKASVDAALAMVEATTAAARLQELPR